jgi:hypothetical protein
VQLLLKRSGKTFRLEKKHREQGCQMVSFQTKNPKLGKFWRVLHRLENVNIFYDRLEYFTVIRDILLTFGTFSVQLVHFSGFNIMYEEKSGNPDRER